MEHTKNELKKLIEQLENLESQFEAQLVAQETLYKVRRAIYIARALLIHVEELFK